MINSINHITIAVSDIERSLAFYVDILDCRPHARWNSGAYLSCGNLWLCLSLDDVRPASDYSHIAFDVAADLFEKAASRILNSDVNTWKENSSEGNSIYFYDPDGHKLELHDGDLQTRLKAVEENPYSGWVRLDDAASWCFPFYLAIPNQHT